VPEVGAEVEQKYEALKKTIEKMPDEVIPDKIFSMIYDFLSDCETLIDKDWKKEVMKKSGEMIKDTFKKMNESEKPEIKPSKSEMINQIRNHMRWVIPVPPNPDRVAEIIERDRKEAGMMGVMKKCRQILG